MSVREFWNDEPSLMWAYRKSYMDKIKLENELANYNAWLNGLYVFDAVSVSLYNCLGREKGQMAKGYIEKPYDFNKTKEQIKEEEIKEKEQQVKNALKRMKNALKNKQGVDEKG